MFLEMHTRIKCNRYTIDLYVGGIILEYLFWKTLCSLSRMRKSEMGSRDVSMC